MAEATMKTRRQDMYKARTPPWKETYRKRCLDRLRGSREKLMTRFRKIDITSEKDDFIKDIMTDELKTLKREQAKDLDIEFEDTGFNGVDLMLNLFEDIQEELKHEELRLLEEHDRYEHSLKLEENVLCSAIEKLSTDEVICPICQKSTLLLNKNIIFCSCGVRIDTEQDCISLSNVKNQLEASIYQHSLACTTDPTFSIIADFGTQHLLMSCQVCDAMDIIV
ncbi:hypothetical protein LOTGIDRAFT_231480 [Lottia gigantea]|uniref:RPA-interacting protein C-terminal domain-containing protein n=1 Tax=Lottia gigantea TaxID=225164 RepID=V4AU19_LOTGI|nr:hypothetical protein LOTGIDRAFT_231480 [Lottia gigantea]ESO97271.1 hypothetical protein LOTGIDRAFT_231480 [Lottia gigantea]